MVRAKHTAAPLLLIALIAAVASHVSAEGDDRSAVDRWGQSLGGVHALAAIEEYHLVYGMESAGHTGTLEVWQTADGRRRIEIRLGDVFSHTNIFDGTASFASENGGAYREVAGSDYATVVSYAYMESFSVFLSDRMKAPVPPTTDVVNDVTMCTVTPVAGYSMRYYLGEDYLPDSMAFAADGRKMVTKYSEWKTAEGVLWPHVQLLTTGDSRFDEKYTLRSVETNPGLNDSLFIRPSGHESRVKFPEGADKVELAIDLFGNHIFVPVRINGRDTTLWFIFDTGAEMSVLNKDRLAPLGLETSGTAEGYGVGEGSVEVSFATGVTLDIAGATVENLSVAAISLDGLAPYLGRTFDGILGGDIISEFIARIDYRDSLITLYPRGAFAPPKAAQEMKVSFEGTIPYVDANIRNYGGVQARCRFYLDTGKGAGISIYHHFAEAKQLIGGDIPFVEAPSGFGVGGQTTARFIRVPEFSFGGATIAKTLVAVELGSESRDSVNYEQGSIGGDFLRFFTLTFDYGKETVWVEQAYEAVGRGEMDMLGVTIREKRISGEINGFEIVSVLPNSPAEEADLAAGDVITAVDGVAASDFTLPAVRDLFKSRPGRELQLSFTREARSREVTVVLRRMI